MIRRLLATLLVLVIGSPPAVMAQAPKAGIVTNSEGRVNATRVALPGPVPLKFKDDVFLRDRITTAENSFARLLLGGKAVVTVRERSQVTITEIPGQSIVDLHSGKIGLAVARERMQPGEVIELRMPNAVVGVRGTVLVADVIPGASGGSGTETAYMLRGSAEARLRTAGPATVGTIISAFQSFAVSNGVASVGTFTPEAVAGIISGLRAPSMSFPEAANPAETKVVAQTATSAAITALVDSGALVPPTNNATNPPPGSTEQTTTSAPITPVSSPTAIEQIGRLSTTKAAVIQRKQQ